MFLMQIYPIESSYPLECIVYVLCIPLGNFGLELNSDLTEGTSSGDIQTFHTIQLSEQQYFSIDHVEVRTFWNGGGGRGGGRSFEKL